MATDAGPAVVSGSMRDLSLLVRNLIDNAIRYTRPAARSPCRWQQQRRGAAGRRRRRHGHPLARPAPGVRAVLPRRSSRSRETGGTGLGLAIVKHVAENHGGTVDVMSELGRGRPSPCGSRPPVPRSRPERTARMLLRDDHPVPDPPRPHRPDRREPVRAHPRDPARRTRPAQAVHLAERFRSVRLTAIYSSPLERCVQTVEPLAAAQRLPILERDGLMEMDVGAWTGRTLKSLRRTKRWGEIQGSPSTVRLPRRRGVRRSARLGSGRDPTRSPSGTRGAAWRWRPTVTSSGCWSHTSRAPRWMPSSARSSTRGRSPWSACARARRTCIW